MLLNDFTAMLSCRHPQFQSPAKQGHHNSLTQSLSDETVLLFQETLSHLMGVEIAHERVKYAFSQRENVDFLSLFGSIDERGNGRIKAPDIRQFMQLMNVVIEEEMVLMLMQRYATTTQEQQHIDRRHNHVGGDDLKMSRRNLDARRTISYADFIRELTPN